MAKGFYRPQTSARKLAISPAGSSCGKILPCLGGPPGPCGDLVSATLREPQGLLSLVGWDEKEATPRWRATGVRPPAQEGRLGPGRNGRDRRDPGASAWVPNHRPRVLRSLPVRRWWPRRPPPFPLKVQRGLKDGHSLTPASTKVEFAKMFQSTCSRCTSIPATALRPGRQGDPGVVRAQAIVVCRPSRFLVSLGQGKPRLESLGYRCPLR